MSDPTREALQAVWDLGDQLDSNHTRWAAGQIADRLGVTIRAHNDFSGPPRNRNEEQIAALQARIDELESAALSTTPAPACDHDDEHGAALSTTPAPDLIDAAHAVYLALATGGTPTWDEYAALGSALNPYVLTPVSGAPHE